MNSNQIRNQIITKDEINNAAIRLVHLRQALEQAYEQSELFDTIREEIDRQKERIEYLLGIQRRDRIPQNRTPSSIIGQNGVGP